MPKKSTPRPPGNTPGKEYLQSIYTKLTLRFDKGFAARMKGEADAQEISVTRLIVETLCERFGWPVPQDKRKTD